MIEVDPALNAIVGNCLAAHLDSLFKTHVVDGTASKLKKNRSFHLCSGFHYASKSFEIVEVGCENSRLVCLAFFKKFLNVHNGIDYCYKSFNLRKVIVFFRIFATLNHS